MLVGSPDFGSLVITTGGTSTLYVTRNVVSVTLSLMLTLRTGMVVRVTGGGEMTVVCVMLSYTVVVTVE